MSGRDDEGGGGLDDGIETGRLCQRLARRFSEAVLADMRARGYVGLAPSHTVLIALLPPEGARVTDLARQAGMTKQGMGKLARELEAAGYVARTPDPADTRAAILRFTTEGERLLIDSYDAKAAVEDRWRSVLGDADHASLRDMLSRLVRNEE